MIYDLHVHSTHTDGKHSREEIIEFSKAKKLEYLSFTEHNYYFETVSDDIEIINGIEFDVKCGESFHLLCYFPNLTPDIERLLKRYRDNTSDSTLRLVEKIKKNFNFDSSFSYDSIPGKNGYKTKRDVITWLVNNHYCKTVDEASLIFTGKKAISYVPKFSLTFEEVVDAIHISNGLVVLAHPESLKMNNSDLNCFLRQLVINGLDGIEVLNVSKNKEKKELYYLELARKYNLLTSSGSDFHDIYNHQLGVNNDYSSEIIKRFYKK